jgi:N-formylglutamate amidohydrolase
MFCDTLPSFVNARSPRVRMGLGTIARVVASGEEIYARKLYFAEAKQRVDALYYPYHETLRGLIEETEEAFGGCLLIDCHSMPSAAGTACGQDVADIVLGDCHGTACAPQIIEAARGFFAERQFAVALNAPYSGGFTTGHYGSPARRRHALQIEINRGLYMDERSYRRKPAFARLAAELAALIEYLGEVMHECLAGQAEPRAAE